MRRNFLLAFPFDKTEHCGYKLDSNKESCEAALTAPWSLPLALLTTLQDYGDGRFGMDPSEENDLHKCLKDFTQSPSYCYVVPSMGNQERIFFLWATSDCFSMAKVSLIAFLFRCIELTFPPNIAYVAQQQKIVFRFSVVVQMQKKFKTPFYQSLWAK